MTLDRPDAMNALDTELKVALRDTLAALAEDDAVRAVVLTGSGRAFCVGQDLAEHARNLRDDRDAVWSTVPEHYTPIATLLATMPKPVVAAVNGTAAGAGAAFAFACDFRVAADSARFTMVLGSRALRRLGVVVGLPRLVGLAKAKELLMLGPTLTAAQALELGLLTEVVPADQVATRAGELAVRLAQGPTLALGAIRQALAYSPGTAWPKSPPSSSR